MCTQENRPLVFCFCRMFKAKPILSFHCIPPIFSIVGTTQANPLVDHHQGKPIELHSRHALPLH